VADYPAFVDAFSMNSAGGAPTDDDIGFPGALEDADKVLLFTCYSSFAFAAINYVDATESRIWYNPLWGISPYAGAGPYVLWTAVPFMHRYAGDDSNLRINGNSAPSVLGWVAYRGLPNFTHVEPQHFGVGTDIVYSGNVSDTMALAACPNFCTGGKNVSWLVFVSSSATAVPTWPAGVTELFTHSKVSFGTISVAEQRNNGAGDWPAVSMTYTGGALGAFGGVSLGRLMPLFRQDGEV